MFLCLYGWVTFSELTPIPTPTPEGPATSPAELACDDDGDMDMDMAPVRSDAALAGPKVLPGEMVTPVGGDAETLVDELSPDRTAELEQQATPVRDASRKKDFETATSKDSGVEELQHNSPGHCKEQIAPQERDTSAQDPREHMSQAEGRATPFRDQTVSHEGRPQDMAEPERDATPRQQATWVNDAVLAANANKKVRSLISNTHDQY